MSAQNVETGSFSVEVIEDGRWTELSETTSLQTAILRARALYSMDKTQPVRVVAHLPQGMKRIYTLVAQSQEQTRYDMTTGLPDFGRKLVTLVGLGVAASTLALIGASLSSLIDGSRALRLFAF